MDVSVSWPVVIISLCVRLSKHQVACFKLRGFLFLNYTPVKPERENDLHPIVVWFFSSPPCAPEVRKVDILYLHFVKEGNMLENTDPPIIHGPLSTGRAWILKGKTLGGYKVDFQYFPQLVLLVGEGCHCFTIWALCFLSRIQTIFKMLWFFFLN